jgi:signal transduction histidine kinase
MKPGKLYLRIFLSFLVFLIITEIAIFAVFILGFGRNYQQHYNQYNESKLAMVKDLIESAAAGQKENPLTNNKALNELVPRLGNIFKSMVWLADADGKIVIKSFKGRIPYHFIEEYMEELEETGNRRYFGKSKWHWNIYLVDSITVDDQKIASLHILFKDKNPQHPGWGFAFGLIAIGVIIALMIIPVSRQISNPIKSLTLSAKRIEAGELSHRANVKRKDEIGELGRAFNAMAEKAENMILGGKELTAQVSHELRSPLARMQLAVELMKDQAKSQNENWADIHLSDIQEDVEELDRLIGRILELSKLDIGETGSYTERFKPDALLNSIVNRFQPVLNNKSIHLTSDLKTNVEIDGNQEAFVSALSNLVDNACKFTPTEGTISLQTQVDNSALSITISNSCPPLTEEEISKIFDPFYRTDPSRENGVGLGLAIARKLIEKHGGTIEAVCANEELTMSVKLPV